MNCKIMRRHEKVTPLTLADDLTGRVPEPVLVINAACFPGDTVKREESGSHTAVSYHVSCLIQGGLDRASCLDKGAGGYQWWCWAYLNCRG